MSEKRVLPNGFFEEIAFQLRQKREVRVSVQGNSMYPFLHSGDTIMIRPLQTDEKPPLYCALFYRWQGRFMTHRLIKAEGEILYLLGDGNCCRIEQITHSDVFGILTVCIRPNGKHIDCLTNKWLILGKIWYLLRPIRPIILKLLRIVNY